MKNKKAIKTVSVLILIAVVAFSMYRFGYLIPGLKQIPFFSSGHRHEYRPVLGENGEIEYWTCAMHPSVKMKESGNCPICGMELTPVMKQTTMSDGQRDDPPDEDPPNNEDMAGMQGHDHEAHVPKPRTDGTGTEPKSEFAVSPQRQQMIGVKTEPVEMRKLDKTIRTVGMVKLDETLIEHVHTKFSGWIDKVFVDYTGEHVSKGQPLFSIYSPELVSTQEEYLLALRSKDILSDSEFPNISRGATSLLEATKRRLRLWDVSDAQIREIAETGKVKDSIVIYSPVSGHVMEKNAFENQFVEPSTELYMIADHSKVWVDVDIYENEIPLIHTGDEAVMTLASYPGEEFTGKVTFIMPHLNSKTRTVKVRLEFPNPNLKLLPEMYADINFEVQLGKSLSIPESAVLRTGKQDIVFVDKGEGKMQIRKVELGRKAGGYYEVLGGLREGEKVVTRANFLIDSESKVQAAVATWDEDSESDDENMQKSEPRLEQETGDDSTPGQHQLHNH